MKTPAVSIALQMGFLWACSVEAQSFAWVKPSLPQLPKRGLFERHLDVGWFDLDSTDGFLGDTWVWHGKAKTWIQMFPATSPSPRGTTLTYDHASEETIILGGETSLAYDVNIGEVVLFGGYNAVGGEALNDTWTWKGTTWSQVPPWSTIPA
jgi:hypothetical protein